MSERPEKRPRRSIAETATGPLPAGQLGPLAAADNAGAARGQTSAAAKRKARRRAAADAAAAAVPERRASKRARDDDGADEAVTADGTVRVCAMRRARFRRRRTGRRGLVHALPAEGRLQLREAARRPFQVRAGWVPVLCGTAENMRTHQSAHVMAELERRRATPGDHYYKASAATPPEGSAHAPPASASRAADAAVPCAAAEPPRAERAPAPVSGAPLAAARAGCGAVTRDDTSSSDDYAGFEGPTGPVEPAGWSDDW